MNRSRHCTECGAELTRTMPLGLCPQCLIRLGLAAGPQESASTADGSDVAPSPALGTSTELPLFGDYQLLEEIGRGGMGVVYKARQLSLDRLVALKTILFGPLATPEQIRRFRTEASAAAALQHPNIVAVHEVGVHQNQHYLVMDLVDGPNLGRLVRDKPLPARQAATHLKAVAEAIHFAHERGILHRDLKPSNVLVGSDDRPRVADFGLARRLGTDSSLTLTGQMLGSPNYMPPEQAAGGGGKVGRPADVYGLGAILYHLSTGRPPFQAETIPQTIQLVTSAEPLSPRVLVPSVPRDLETICLKCLEKDPAKRYPTAQALAEELDRVLKGEPIHARPVGAVGKAWRWCRRKPAVATTLAVSLASLLVISVVSSVSAVRTNRARQAERLEAYYSAIALADQYVQQGNIQGAKDLLFGCPAEFRHWEWGHLMYLCHQDVLSIATYTNQVPVDTTSPESVANAPLGKRLAWLSFSPDGSALITQGVDGSVKVWSVEDGRLRFTVGDPTNGVHWYTVDPLSHRLATGGRNGTAEVFDLASGRMVFTTVHASNAVCCTALDPAGRQLVTGGGGVVSLWDVERKERLRRWEVGPEGFDRFDLSKDATRLVTQQGRLTRIWEVNTGAEVLRVTPQITNGVSYTLNESASVAVAFDTDNRAWLWRTNGTCVALGQIRGAMWESYRWAAFSADDRLVCTGGDQGTARVWDTDSGAERLALPGRVSRAAISPDGTSVAEVSTEHIARIWDIATGRETRTLRGHAANVEHIQFSPDGRLVATADRDGTVKLWSAREGREVLRGDSWSWGGCYSSDGKRLASISNPVLDVRVWDSQTGDELLRFRPGMEHTCYSMKFSPDGRHLATCGGGGDVRLWDSTTGAEVRRFPGYSEVVILLAFSPDGRQLAAGTCSGGTVVWDAETGARLHTFTVPIPGVVQVLFSPDGRRLYAASPDGYVRAWDTRSWQLQMQVGRVEPRPTLMLCGVTPDSRRLYTADLSEDRMRVWDAVTGHPLEAARAPPRQGYCLTFTPDGRRMAMTVASAVESVGSGEVLSPIVDVEHGREVLTLRGHTEPVLVLEFDATGRRLLSCGGDFTTRQWETFPWREEEYGEESGVRDHSSFPDRVRAYADRYWRERLRAEATAKPAAPRQPMVRWDRSLWPKRDERSGPNQIDLTEHYTTRLDVPIYPVCFWAQADDDLRNLPSGTVVLSDVAFDIRGVITLRCLKTRGYPFLWLWEQHPERVDGVRVGESFRRLHVLQGMLFVNHDPVAVEDGATIGRYAVRYSDGTQAELPIVVGRHVRHWWAQADEENPFAPLPEGTVVWTGSNPSARDAKATLRLYLTSYDNPHPEKEVVSVDYVSAMTTAAPFLVAMTVEP